MKMNIIDIEQPNWDKGGSLLPAIIQDANNKTVLMLGYMNKAALKKTQESGYVTFFSRSKNRLWMKGETSGNTLDFVSIQLDCDDDTLLVQARPNGPVCHTGTQTCFGDNDSDDDKESVTFLNKLSLIIKKRRKEKSKNSYTVELFQKGSKRIAQKVGEEGVELSLAYIIGNKKEILNETADLIFHILILLEDAKLNINDVCQVLKNRHNS